MASVRFADLQAHPTEFPDLTSLDPRGVSGPRPALRSRVPGAYGRGAPRWVVYLSPAAHSAGPVWSRPRDVNRTVMPLTSGSQGLVQAVCLG